ncbi:hypothetical protein HC891_07465 [Candidatus Gracilibacteria bacterium]|nr:hypothetical protein [Candidatus Gracilibacteria bacterium]
MFSITFGGWFQCRLATDPDPTDEPRGVSGYTFAVGDEPDLDRVLRLNDPVALRSHAPEVGVLVRSVSHDGAVLIDHPLIGARVDLLDGARFEMRNYILAAQPGTQAINPFNLQIGGNGILLRRADILDLDHPDWPITSISDDKLLRRGGNFILDYARFVQVTKLPDYASYRLRRKALLEADLVTATDPLVRAALQKRLSEFAIDEQTPDDRRRRGLGFVEERAFAINGPGLLDDPHGKFGFKPDFSRPWPISFWNGVWDCDALCGYMQGDLLLPLHSHSGVRSQNSEAGLQ